MKIIIRVLLTLAALIVVIAVALPFLVDVNQFRPRLQSELSNSLGRPVTIGNLSLSIFSGSVAASDVSIADDPAFGTAPFLQAKSLSAGVEIFPLVFSRKIDITRIVIDQPEISLLQKPTGEWNYSKLGGAAQPAPLAPPSSGAPVDLSVKLVKISDGRLTIAKTSGPQKPLILDKVNISLNDFSRSTAFPFSLDAKLAGGGDLKIDGKAGPISPDDVELTPVNLTLKATHVDLLASGAVNPADGIAGTVALDATGASDGKQIELKGKVQAEQLKLVKGASPATKPAQFDFTLHHVLATHAGSLLQGDIHIGKADAKLTGTYVPQGDSMTVTANLDAPNMSVQELEGMLPALNIVLPAGAKLQGGAVSAKLNSTGLLENLTTTGVIGLSNVKLAGFDLGSKMTAIQSLAGIKNTPTTEIQTLRSDVKSTNAGVNLDNIKLVASNIGELSGSGTVTPDHALNFRMTVSVTSGLLPAVLGARTQAGIPFFIHGTASDPKFEPDLKGMAENEVKNLKGDAGKAATGILSGFFGKKK